MRPIYINQASVASSAWKPVDSAQAVFAIGFGCVVTGTVNYTVEHTFDDVFNSTVTPTAFPHATVAAQTASKDGNYAFPVRAVRLTVNSGTGSVAMTLLQGLES